MRVFGFDIQLKSSREIALENEVRSLQNQQAAYAPWGAEYNAMFTGSGTVTRKKALTVPSIYAAVDVVSKTLASLPFEPFRRTPTGAEPATTHPLYVMETLEPSPLVTAFNFRRDMFADACFGNACAKITFKGNGRAASLERMPPDDYWIYPSENGKIYYVWHRRVGAYVQEEILFPYEVLHLRGMTLDGWDGGLDVASNFSASINMSIDATSYGGNFYHNNAAVGGVVEYPGGLTPLQRQQLEDKINAKHTGIRNVGSTMVLDAGMKFQPVKNNPQEAALNETRTFQAYESCRIFGVPAHMINVLDRSTFNNIEMMDNGFVKYCLAPWAQNFEQECDVKLLTNDEKQSGSIFHRFDLSGLLRGDMKSQGEFYEKMLKGFVMCPNDVRKILNMNDAPWGSTPFAPSGTTNVAEDGTIQAPEAPEKPETPGDTSTDKNTEDEPQPGA
jgi:HK97 family phage portal protein